MVLFSCIQQVVYHQHQQLCSVTYNAQGQQQSLSTLGLDPFDPLDVPWAPLTGFPRFVMHRLGRMMRYNQDSRSWQSLPVPFGLQMEVNTLGYGSSRILVNFRRVILATENRKLVIADYSNLL